MDKTKAIIEKLKKISHLKKNKNNNFFLIFTIKIILIFFCLLFLSINIVFSQNISSLFLGVINFDKNSVVFYLQKIKNTPIFKDQLKYFENFYQESLESQVFAQENSQKQEIKKLEQILEKNPYSRDVLYRLFQDYQELGSQKKANEYLIKAKQLDPNL